MLAQLIDDLKLDEGWRASVYQDSEGYWTVGYGFMVDARRGGELPREVGEYWLKHAVEARWKALVARLPWVEDQPVEVQLALGNLAYQLGVEGLCGFKRMLAALEAGDRETAAKEALDSKWAKQTPARAQRVSASILGG